MTVMHDKVSKGRKSDWKQGERRRGREEGSERRGGRGRERDGESEGAGEEMEDISPIYPTPSYTFIYLHIPSYTLIYLYILPNTFIYLHILPYTSKYPILGIREST